MTGKNKENFEKWYENKPLIDRTNPIRPRLAETFFKYPFEMQIGVYLAYYDVWCARSSTEDFTEPNRGKIIYCEDADGKKLYTDK